MLILLARLFAYAYWGYYQPATNKKDFQRSNQATKQPESKDFKLDLGV